MIKYAKVINEKTKECQVGIGPNTVFYQKIGFTEMNVDKCEWNGGWYLAGYVPAKPKPSAEEKIATLKQELSSLDEKSIRSVRAKLAGTATPEDEAFLAQLEEQAETLRQQIKELQGE